MCSAVARERAFALDGDREVVPEPDVKAALRARGVAVPPGVTGATVTEVVGAASTLRAPLVLKAFGPGLLHKTDVDAVVLGVGADELEAATARLGQALAARGLTPTGFLVEEQLASDRAIEVVAGVVRRAPFGLMVALGLGGTLAEVLDLVALRPFPLRRSDARALVDEFPGAAALAGSRGGPPLARDGLAEVLLALAGADGLAAALGDELDELECNPVLVSRDAASVLDARLVLRRSIGTRDEPPPPTDFTRLFAPRAIAVAGASTTRANFGNRALAAYRAIGWDHGLYALHPDATSIDGVPAYRDLADIDEPVDYLMVTVPAARCAGVVRAAGGRAPFAQVVSGGFGEIGDEGTTLSRDLVDAARETSSRVVGPNCIGTYCPSGRQTFQLGAPATPGAVSVISQSGGLAGDVVMAGARHGLRFSKVLSVGNSVDVTPAEVLTWLVDDDETAVLGCYLETASGAEALVGALHRARGTLPVALLVGGQSAQGGRAAVSHTGALAAEPRIWRAVAAATGASLVETLEELVAVLAYLQRWTSARPSVSAGITADAGVLVVGMGGGASVLATDMCAGAELTVTPTHPEVQAALRGIGLGVGTSVANPLEIPFGPLADVEALRRVLEPTLALQPYSDVLVHVNVSAYYGYGTLGVVPLVAQLADLATAELGGARLAMVLRNLTVAPAADVEMLEAAVADQGLVAFGNLADGTVAVAAARRFDAARRDRVEEHP